jgi:hypothetical protein
LNGAELKSNAEKRAEDDKSPEDKKKEELKAKLDKEIEHEKNDLSHEEKNVYEFLDKLPDEEKAKAIDDALNKRNIIQVIAQDTVVGGWLAKKGNQIKETFNGLGSFLKTGRTGAHKDCSGAPAGPHAKGGWSLGTNLAEDAESRRKYLSKLDGTGNEPDPSKKPPVDKTKCKDVHYGDYQKRDENGKRVHKDEPVYDSGEKPDPADVKGDGYFVGLGTGYVGPRQSGTAVGTNKENAFKASELDSKTGYFNRDGKYYDKYGEEVNEKGHKLNAEGKPTQQTTLKMWPLPPKRVPKTQKSPVYEDGLSPEQEHAAHESHHKAHTQQHAIEHTVKEVAAIIGGAVAGPMVLSKLGIGQAATTAGTEAAHHGAGELAKHILKDAVKHAGLEMLGVNTAEKAAVGGLGASIATAGVLESFMKEMTLLSESTTNEDFNKKFFLKLTKMMMEAFKTYKMTPEQKLESLRTYKGLQYIKKEDGKKADLTNLLKEDLSDTKKQSIQHFVEYATKRLKLAEIPNVTLIGGNEYGNVKSSLGGYSPEDKSIYVSTEGRLTADILRTIAHEMVHRKQDEMGYIKDSVQDGSDGSPIENQAHSVAGILMREYGRINKQIYQEAHTAYNHIPVSKADKDFTNNHKSDIGIEADDDTIDFDGKGGYQTVEDINVDVDKGDTVLMGKFKNKKTTVKDIGKDDWGMPTINGKKATTFRIPRGEEEKSNPQSVFNEVGTNDWHFKAIMKMWDTTGSFGKKKIGVVVCNNPKASKDDIARKLRGYGYGEVTHVTDKLGLDENNSLNDLQKQRMVLYTKAFKMMPNSPAQLKVRADIDRLSKEIERLEKKNINESTPSEIIKDLDKVRHDLIKKVDVLIAKKKKLYSNVDIESPMSADEKQLDKDIQSIFSQIQQIILKKRTLKESLNEAIKWEEDTFRKCMLGKLPLSLNIVQKLVNPIKATTLHITDIANLPKVAALEGTKKSISTFNKTTKWGKIAQGKGLWTEGGVMVALSGTILAQSIMDLWTEPDKQGRRWVNPGTVIANLGREQDVVFNFAPELQPYKEKFNKHYFDGTITNAEKAEFIKKYYEAAERYMLSKKKDFQETYSNSKGLHWEVDWNEVVLTNIKIEKILVIPSVMKTKTKVGAWEWDTKDEADKQKEIDKIKQKYKNVEVAKNEADIQNFINNNGGQVMNESVNKKVISEGGAYGHMSHPFDDMDLTFGDLKNIIKGALTGNLELTREKTDGQALAISWKNGRLIAARNKSHLQNAGAGAMGIEDVASKFGGRGGLTDAYNFAMKDLSAAVQSLSEAQRKKIFNEGKCFMNLEVIWPTSVNVIPYGQALLIFHNTTCYDEKGSAIGANQGAATMLAGMIKQVNADVQSKYTIQGPPVTELPKKEELSSKQTKYLTQLQKIQFQFQLSDKDGVSEYHQAWWEDFVNKSKVKLQKLEKEALVRRWAFGDKSFRLNTIADKDAQSWAIENDKVNVTKQQKDNVRQFEEIFLGVGADVLSFMGSVLTVNPDAAVRSMKDRLKSTAEKVRGSGDVSKIAKLKMELSRLTSIGGANKIVPNEGIVFVYKGNTYKLTGTFAPLNQILGIFYE